MTWGQFYRNVNTMRTKAARSLAEKLTPAPSESGYNQTTLAAFLGVTKGAVNEWCQGKSRPRPDVMRRLQDLFGVPMQDWTEPSDERDAQ